MKKCVQCISLLVLFLSIPIHSQEKYREVFPSYSVSEIEIGITDKELGLRYISKDTSGYVWMTSQKGLIVSDKSSAVQYKNGVKRFPLLKDSISSHIAYFVKDKEDNFIVTLANDNIIFRYNPHQRIITDTVVVKPNIPARDLFVEEASDGSLLYVYGNGTTVPFTLYKVSANGKRNALFTVPQYEGVDQNLVFLASMKGQVLIFMKDFLYCVNEKGELLKKVKCPEEDNRFRFSDKDEDKIYFVDWFTEEIFYWDTEALAFKSFFKMPFSMNLPVRFFMVNGDKISTINEEQLLVFDLKEKTYQDLMPIYRKYFELNSKNQTPASLVKGLIEANGNILAISKNGLYQFAQVQDDLSYFENSITSLENQPSMRAFGEDPEGNIYACYYVGLAKKQKGENAFKPVSVPKSPLKRRISTYNLNFYKDYIIWDNQLIDTKNNSSIVTTESTTIAHTTQFLKKDSLWSYTWWTNTLSFYDLKKQERIIYPFDVSTYPDVEFEMINTIVEDANGKNFWIGTQSNGICLLSKKGKLIKQYSSDFLKMDHKSDVFDLRLEGDVIWYAGTLGLGTINTKTEEVSFLQFLDSSNEQALSYRQIYFIEPLNDNYFYLGTDIGIILFNKKERSYVELDVNQPLASLEFNRASHFKSSEGKYYFGTTSGIYSFYPEDLKWKQKAKDIPMRIDEIAIFSNEGDDRFFSEGVNKIEKIEVKPTDASIEVLCSSLKDTEDVFYSYRINSITDNWSIYTTENRISLLSLPAGTFDLEIRNNISPDLVKTLQLNKQEFWHKRWYVQLGFLLAIGTMVFSFMRYRYRQRLAKEKELAGLRDKISSDLHDDVGSILTAVAMQSEVLQMKAMPEQKSKLERIGGMTREAMSRMRDTVWSIDSQKDTLESLADRINDFLVDAMQDNDAMKHTFKHINKLPVGYKINPIIRQNVYLVCKEAITNAIKHSNGDQLSVTLKSSKKHIELRVEDNGTVSQNINTSGLGLSSMKRRAEKINGLLDITTQNGFMITLTVNN